MSCMLTKEDLTAIGNLIDEKLDNKLDEKFKKELKPIKKELKQLRFDMDCIVKFFDNDIDGLRKRVDRLEDYLRLSRLS